LQLADSNRLDRAEVDPSTIWRWVQRHAPRLEKETRWHQGYSDLAWRVDET
jgi:transposase, IS6 family